MLLKRKKRNRFSFVKSKDHTVSNKLATGNQGYCTQNIDRKAGVTSLKLPGSDESSWVKDLIAEQLEVAFSRNITRFPAPLPASIAPPGELKQTPRTNVETTRKPVVNKQQQIGLSLYQSKQVLLGCRGDGTRPLRFPRDWRANAETTLERKNKQHEQVAVNAGEDRAGVDGFSCLRMIDRGQLITNYLTSPR